MNQIVIKHGIYAGLISTAGYMVFAFIDTDLPTYGDKEDAVVLMKSSSVVIDELQYNDEFHNDLIDDLNGVSLERIDPNAPTQSIGNWHSAAGEGQALGWFCRQWAARSAG